MSRIDVLPAEKGKFRVLVNFIQRGVLYKASLVANHEATMIHDTMPNAELKLIEEV